MNWSPLHAHLHQTLRDRALLPHDCRVLVGVSGGQDSIALIRLLAELQPHWGWQLQAVHCNHGWRADAGANANFVTQVLGGWQIPCEVVEPIHPPAGEAAARHWRYAIFHEVAHRDRCTAVVTGHTASDRAETLLYNLVRGSGAEGLQALAWQRPLPATDTAIRLVRPLLDITRAQITEFCQTQDLPLWEDSTNRDLTYVRNRLRLEVLPLLRQHFNPQVDRTLAQTAEILSAEVDYLMAEADRLWRLCWDAEHSRLNRRILTKAPLALQRRVMRHWLDQITPKQIRFAHVEKLVALITAPNRSQTDPLPSGAIARTRHEWIEIVPINPISSTDSITQDDSEMD